MSFSRIFFGFFLLASTVLSASYAAEVRVCNKTPAVLENFEVNYWKYRKLNSGECTDYYKDPRAQNDVTIGVRINGKSFTYRSKGTSVLLDDGRYSYEISLASEQIHLETIKD